MKLTYKLNNFLLFLFIVIILYYLFPKILYSFFITPIIKDKQIYLFADWRVIISAIKCKLLNYNTFINNPCDVYGRLHVYGSILLFIPYIEKYSIFYFFYFPIFINLIFIAVVILHFNFTSLKEYFLCLIFVLNPSTLLAMERLNFDILIFLLMILLCYFRNNILNLLLICFLTLAKFYPISLLPLFFLNNKNKKIKITNFLFVIFFLFLVTFFLYLDKDNLVEIVRNQLKFSASYQWSFNIYALSKIPILLNIVPQNLLVLFSWFCSIFFVFIGVLVCQNILYKNNYILTRSWSYNETLFLISAGVLVSTYFAFNNFIYREIFIFGLIPLSLELGRDNLFFKNLISFIIFRLFYFTISSYFSIFRGDDFLLIFNQIIDISFISFILGALLYLYLKLLISSFRFRKTSL
jgi:hypothetical protein